MIEFRSVSYKYPDGPLALENVSMIIEQGCILALVGKNGAGKTTLVKCLNGLIKPTSGQVIVNGKNTRDASVAELSKTVGLVFQNPDNQLFSPTVRDELAFSLKNRGTREEDLEPLIDETLKEFNLVHLKNRSPFLLSGGERKRVAMASLACMKQPVLVMDEPTQGQDGTQKRNLENMFRRLQENGRTLIIVSHDVDFVARLANRVIVMEKGHVLVDGSVEDAFQSRQHLDVEHLVPTQELELKWFHGMKHGNVQGLIRMPRTEFFKEIRQRIR
ncbi:ATP-binding cassette domain-containing protein [Candidatus Bathyarchaeota archaeon]|nr:ATP-binding cassette domain-containing protein [Candidatus Bathyarchaeota archaeon]